MIPKVIHYCWFGRGKMPEMAIKCMASWAKFLPNYELRVWNEDTFDINSVLYVKEAYEARKFAFVTDYVRLYAIYNFGGIYMDTDVEVLKNLDVFLKYPAFSGFETKKEVPTGVMASEKLGLWAKEQLKYYEKKHFLLPNGNFDTTTNVKIITTIMSGNGLKLNNTFQVYNDIMYIFPKEYFCPKNRDGSISLTENTYCIHHFAGSWLPLHLKIKKMFFHQILGTGLTGFLVKTKQNVRNAFKKENK